ncbi:MAG: hypothetical protein JXB38_15850 [Anaerolineales bacterium]|nr:hypothetical protein [Anaerolineales bacterium]
MSSNLRDSLTLTWKWLQDLNSDWLPIRSQEEVTRASWAKLVPSCADLPVVFQDFFESFTTDGHPFPYAVLTPSYLGYMHRETEKLVFVLGAEIYILEASGDGYETICYPFGDIAYVETRSVLLDSSIKFSGVTRQGDRAVTSFRFNTVTAHLFSPILNGIRLAATDAPITVRSSELEGFDHWGRVNFKFMNYARRSLLEGETVVQAILQPEIRVKVMRVLGRAYYRTLSPPHATILTNQELIVIREEQRRRSDEYGGLWDYIPLDKVAALALDRREDNLLTLAIDLPGEESLAYLFEAAWQPELEQLMEKFREVKGE